jgi:hypothetical protein
LCPYGGIKLDGDEKICPNGGKNLMNESNAVDHSSQIAEGSPQVEKKVRLYKLIIRIYLLRTLFLVGKR